MKPGIVRFKDDAPSWRHDPLQKNRLCSKEAPQEFNDMILRLGYARRTAIKEYAPPRRMGPAAHGGAADA